MGLASLMLSLLDLQYVPLLFKDVELCAGSGD